MAKKIRNVSPYGDLDVPLLGVIVLAGAVADVTDEQAAVLLDQTENWAAVVPDPPTTYPAAVTAPVKTEEGTK